MKKSSFLIVLFSFCSLIAFAQYRSDLPSYYDYSGPLINEHAPTIQNGLNRFFNSIKMSHSYSMSFNSFGGDYQNINAYTNTMHFKLSDRMNGRLDVSFLHSPFGGNQSFSGSNNMHNQVLIKNAELNYKINDKAFIRVQFQQLPRGFGYNPYAFSSYNRYRNDWFWH